MRLGLIARSDNSGLGIQTWEFYRHMQPQKTMVVDISKLNGNATFPERYQADDGHSVIHIKGFPTNGDIDDFLQDLDIVFVAEAPYNFYLYARAKELGIKVAVQYNYEFFDWFAHPEWPKPDMLVSPSMWHYTHVDVFCNANAIKHIYLHCPVNRDAIPRRKIEQAKVFLHPAGRSASHDRNGTKTVIEASKFLKTDAQILIHFQGEQGLAHQTTMTTSEYEDYAREFGDARKLNIIKEEATNYADVYAMGDVLVLPRRYGGNCLPVNEALSVGMPVIMPDISPNNSWLPGTWLVPAVKTSEFTPRTTIDVYTADPRAVAERIDRFYQFDELTMQMHTAIASDRADSISWAKMKPKYIQAFQELIG